jgi:hypothetical protein
MYSVVTRFIFLKRVTKIGSPQTNMTSAPPQFSITCPSPVAIAVAVTLTLMAATERFTTRAERSKDRHACVAAQKLQQYIGRTLEEEEMEFLSQVVDQEPGRATTRNKDGCQYNNFVKGFQPVPEKIVKPPPYK